MKANSLIALLLVPGLIGDPVLASTHNSGPAQGRPLQSLFTAQALAPVPEGAQRYTKRAFIASLVAPFFAGIAFAGSRKPTGSFNPVPFPVAGRSAPTHPFARILETLLAGGFLAAAVGGDRDLAAQAKDFMRQRNYQAASNILEVARAHNRSNAVLLGLSAVAAAQLGDFRKAQRFAQAAIKIDNEKPRAWGVLANVLHLGGDLEGALSANEEELRLDSENARSHRFRAQLLCARWQFAENPDPLDLEEAIRQSWIEIGIHPDDGNAFGYLSRLFAYQGKLDEAISAGEKECALQKKMGGPVEFARADMHLLRLYFKHMQILAEKKETLSQAYQLLHQARRRLPKPDFVRLEKLLPYQPRSGPAPGTSRNPERSA